MLLLGSTLVLGISVIIFVKGFILSRLTTELEERGLSIGRNMASNCIEPILVDDLVKLQKLVSNTKQLEKDVIYTFILDDQSVPVAHTFGDYFPKGLADVNPILSNETHKIQILNTEEGLIRDIALPVLNGKLGTVHLGISEKRIREAIFFIVNRLVRVISIIIIIGIGLTYYFARKVLSPLRNVSEAIKKIGEGDLNQKIDIKSEDEIGLLANTFNEMAEKLEKTNLELKNTQNQLIQTAKMATVGQFSAGIAHEINNPLGAIINYVRTTLANPEIKGQSKGYLELTLKGLFRIENIVKQILNYSGQQKFQLKTVNINQLIKDTIPFSQHKLSERKIELTLNLNNTLPDIMADSYQLQQVFINIIKNAIDALHVGGKLKIETSSNDKEIEIKFIDNGEGINEEELDRIFDPFYTAKEVGKGTGLGLFISYNIVQTHRGTINIKSKEGKGTTVIITFPAKNK
jgi:signal transduction histidine kinase